MKLVAVVSLAMLVELRGLHATMEKVAEDFKSVAAELRVDSKARPPRRDFKRGTIVPYFLASGWGTSQLVLGYPTRRK
jgi:hypothetical protein